MKRHGESLNAYYYVKEANLKAYILYDSNYRDKTFWKRQNCGDTGKESVVARAWGRGEGRIGGVQRICRAVKILCMIP